MDEKRPRGFSIPQRCEEVIKRCKTVSSHYCDMSPEACLQVFYKQLSLYEDQSRLTLQNVIQYILVLVCYEDIYIPNYEGQRHQLKYKYEIREDTLKRHGWECRAFDVTKPGQVDHINRIVKSIEEQIPRPFHFDKGFLVCRNPKSRKKEHQCHQKGTEALFSPSLSH